MCCVNCHTEGGWDLETVCTCLTGRLEPITTVRSGVPLDDTKDDTAGEFTRWIFFHELLPPLLLLLRLDFAGFDVNEGEVVGDMGGEGEGVSELHPVGLPSILCGERNDPLIMYCLLCVGLCCVCVCLCASVYV